VRFYTGVGSRETPTRVMDVMTLVSSALAGLGYTLRSGASAGADSALENGIPKEDISIVLGRGI